MCARSFSFPFSKMTKRARSPDKDDDEPLAKRACGRPTDDARRVLLMKKWQSTSGRNVLDQLNQELGRAAFIRRPLSFWPLLGDILERMISVAHSWSIEIPDMAMYLTRPFLALNDCKITFNGSAEDDILDSTFKLEEDENVPNVYIPKIGFISWMPSAKEPWLASGYQSICLIETLVHALIRPLYGDRDVNEQYFRERSYIVDATTCTCGFVDPSWCPTSKRTLYPQPFGVPSLQK